MNESTTKWKVHYFGVSDKLDNFCDCCSLAAQFEVVNHFDQLLWVLHKKNGLTQGSGTKNEDLRHLNH